MKFHWQQSAILAATLCFGMVSLAQAQYVWLDEKGVKQFSDQPPPPNVPKSRILKGPGAKAAVKADTDDTGTATSAAASNTTSAASAPLSIAERNAEFTKRRQEQAEKDKKLADEAARNLAKRKNCEHAKEFQRTLDSGTRIGQFDAAGNQGVMSDEQRAQASRENKQVLADCK